MTSSEESSPNNLGIASSLSEPIAQQSEQIIDEHEQPSTSETTSRPLVWTGKETYVGSTSGLKKTLHGTVYQLKHLMLVLLRVWKKECAFRLATEIDAAEDFDDLVLEYTDGEGQTLGRFVQLKHKIAKNKSIAADDLLDNKNGPFSVRKYYYSWFEIKRHPIFKHSTQKTFTLCTNINLDPYELGRNRIAVEEVESPLDDEFLGELGLETQSLYYKLKGKESPDLWKELESMTTGGSEEQRGKMISDFLNVFILAVKQPNEEELGRMIEKEIGAYDQFNLLNADLLKDSFQNEILDWFKEYKDSGKTCRFLRRDDAEAFFKKLETKLSSIITIGLNLLYSAELKTFEIRYENEITGLRNFLDTSNPITGKRIWKLISSTQTLLTALRVYQTLDRMATDKTMAEKNMTYREKDSYIFIHLKKLLLPEIKSSVLRAFESPGSHNLLVVDCELPSEEPTEVGNIDELCEDLLKIVNNNADNNNADNNNADNNNADNNNADNNKRIILIIQGNYEFTSEFKDSSETHPEKDDDNGINNLEVLSRQKLLGKKVVNFQGQENKTCFADVLGIHNGNNEKAENLTNLGRMIDPNTLIRLIKNEEVRIGSEVRRLDDVDDYYIDRTIFRHVVIKTEILRAPGIPDLFAITGIGIDTLRKLMEGKDEHKHVILENGKEDEQFEKLRKKYPDRNVHWLDSKAGKLIWKETFGNINNLIEFESGERAEYEKYRPDTTCQKMDQLFTDESQPRIIILSDVAGMGKSTALTHLARVMKQDKPNMLVIRIDLNQHTDKLAELQGNRSFDKKGLDEIVDVLVDEFLNLGPGSEAEIFKTIIKGRGEAALFFDGFDEVSPIYDETVLKLLEAISKCKIKKLCVTTRPHTKKLLEKKLATFSHSMLPFSEENQTEFLKNFWKRGLSSNSDSIQNIEELLSGHAKAVIEILKKSIDSNMQEFTGVPLQTRMVAEVFPCGKEQTLPEKIDIIDLYQKFIDTKYDILFSEKKLGERTNQVEIWIKTIVRNLFLAGHEKLALDALFDEVTVADLLRCQPEVGDRSASYFDKNEPEQRAGIINKVTNGKPEFIHRTFAEYFAAVFLTRTLKDDKRNQHVRQFYVSRLFLEPGYKTIRTFINCMLTEKSDELGNIPWGFRLRNYRNAQDRTLYHVAAQESNTGILKFFFNRLNSSLTASICDVPQSRGNRQKAKKKKKKKNRLNKHDKVNRSNIADIDLKDKHGCTALHIALSTTWHTFDVVECLVVDGGADIHCRDSMNRTPLHWAALKGHLNIVEYLADQNRADIHCPDNRDRTPLHWAAFNGHLNIVEYLTAEGADIHCRDNQDRTPLHWAVSKGHSDIVDYLAKKSADNRCRDEGGRSPLHSAAAYGHLGSQGE